MNAVKHPQPIRYVMLQPGSTNGDIFVSSCNDGILRLFDIRRSVTGVYTNLLKFDHQYNILRRPLWFVYYLRSGVWNNQSR